MLTSNTHDPVSSDRALVLFSGGQDSATCLAWALRNYQHVETLAFDYGQRHHVELDCRHTFRAALVERFPHWQKVLGQDHLIELPMLGVISQSAMTEDVPITEDDMGLPNTFVPGRNLLFFTLAAALAHQRKCRVLVGGMCETDYSGYPDCRDDTLKALQVTLNLGMGTRFLIETPLMRLNKAGTWDLAHQLGGAALVDLIRTHTHTCYLGGRDVLHEWGYGCGSCPACILRQRGYQDFSKKSAAHV